MFSPLTQGVFPATKCTRRTGAQKCQVPNARPGPYDLPKQAMLAERRSFRLPRRLISHGSRIEVETDKPDDKLRLVNIDLPKGSVFEPGAGLRVKDSVYPPGTSVVNL